MSGNELENIDVIAKKLGLEYEDYEPYGRNMAKLSLSLLEKTKNNRTGKLILVTSMNPTPAGEGKTTTSIGLGQAFQKLNKKIAIALREPSLGPCFGIKGGATGGGKSKVEPSDRINLLFTSDFPAVSAAHNLLSAMINNHMHHGNRLKLDPKKIQFPRTIDMNDRSLREIVGYSTEGNPVYAGDINAQGSMAALLRDALKPNLVQTTEGVPTFVHTGPFGNIAHGTSSILADKIGLKLVDYLITEAGFGSDLGAEKFFNLVSRTGNLPVDAVVVVSTIRAIKHHGGAKELNEENIAALRDGSANLLHHVRGIRAFGLDPVVAINMFPSDTENEFKTLTEILDAENIAWARSEVFAKGGEGGIDLANKVISKIGNSTPEVKYTYSEDDPVKEKIIKIAKYIYGADDVKFEGSASRDLKKLKDVGMETAPVCMAKTQYSFSDDPKLLNDPKGFVVKVNSVNISSGAGFVVPQLGSIMTMPGLPKKPAAEEIDVTDDGEIENLF